MNFQEIKNYDFQTAPERKSELEGEPSFGNNLLEFFKNLSKYFFNTFVFASLNKKLTNRINIEIESTRSDIMTLNLGDSEQFLGLSPQALYLVMNATYRKKIIHTI